MSGNENNMIKKFLFAVPVSVANKEDALALVSHWLLNRNKKKENSPKIITTPNPEMIVAAQKDPNFLAALQQADLSLADGWGVARAVRAPRISGLEFMELLIQEATAKKWSVVLLGGKPGVADLAKSKFQMSNDKLQITAISGPNSITHASQKERDQLVASINSIHPDLLFVAFGHGKQEPWMVAHREKLHIGVMMGVGGALDQIADPSLRPSPFFDNIGLGWFYRLAREPWRWKRQLSLLTFIALILKEWTNRREE